MHGLTTFLYVEAVDWLKTVIHSLFLVPGTRSTVTQPCVMIDSTDMGVPERHGVSLGGGTVVGKTVLTNSVKYKKD